MKKYWITVLLSIVLCGCSTVDKKEPLSIERGSVETGLYTNETMGIQIEVPNSFMVMSDEQLTQAIDSNAKEKGYDNLQELIDENAITYDFGMVHLASGSTVLVGVENLGLEGAGLVAKNAEDYIALVKKSFLLTEDSMYTLVSEGKVTLQSGEWDYIEFEEKESKIHTRMYIRYNDGYIFMVTMNCVLEEEETVFSLIQ